tara:strand:+ start:241 stop:420 length:180 start_codon:yes stop_codon:yes gene_type:complete
LLLEKNKIRKIIKYKPPIHCEDDLQMIRVGSKYFIFSKVVKPVPVIPEKASNIALINVI